MASHTLRARGLAITPPAELRGRELALLTACAENQDQDQGAYMERRIVVAPAR
jgi:hypothetical protein